MPPPNKIFHKKPQGKINKTENCANISTARKEKKKRAFRSSPNEQNDVSSCSGDRTYDVVFSVL
jgi:hypothetical protein